jgi:N-acetylneuraminate synthase/N,N'-diacetyllegionaminate synthase
VEIIAEIGQNHNGDMGLAKELIASAKECGADVAKFQVYDAVNLFPKEGNEWFDYNCKTELSRDQVSELNAECQKMGIEFMASVFDVERIQWLEEIGVKRHKVASRSINEKEMIDALCATGKPLLVSLGMWDKEEFPQIQSNGELHFLYCVSKYPTEMDDLAFSNIDFNKYSGFSDHTVGVNAALVALSRGAQILEKHYTLDKKAYGPDHEGSMTPSELECINKFREDLNKCL